MSTQKLPPHPASIVLLILAAGIIITIVLLLPHLLFQSACPAGQHVSRFLGICLENGELSHAVRHDRPAWTAVTTMKDCTALPASVASSALSIMPAGQAQAHPYFPVLTAVTAHELRIAVKKKASKPLCSGCGRPMVAAERIPVGDRVLIFWRCGENCGKVKKK